MKKILLSIGSILFAGAILAGGTGAFISDTETSTGNTFASGVVDLLIDNESYVTDVNGNLVVSTSTSWSLSGLSGKLFFNFPDVKPGDIGEDTISVHINNNNAWACMDITLTGTPENGINEPESHVDVTSGTNDGEMQNALYFAFWGDDGDNVYEANEKIFKQGLVKDIFNGTSCLLADSQGNVWNSTKDPITGGSTKYIGKAWCYGDLDPNAVSQDNKGKVGNNGPLNRGTGFKCDGQALGNAYQSDGLKMDVSFDAVQSRNNNGFKCGMDIPEDPEEPEKVKLFFDNFEACQLDVDFDKHNTPKWEQEGGVQAGNGGSGHPKVAVLDADKNKTAPLHTETLTSKSIDMSIYHDITLEYERKTDDTNALPVGNQTLTVSYSTNGGSSWTTLETVTGESNWTSKSFTLSPAANNKSNVKIRFSLTGDDSTNRAYIDNVVITGLTP